MVAVKDLKDKRFGRLTVLERRGSGKWGRARWLCQCDCGKQVLTFGQLLLAGKTKSCGCFQRNRAKEANSGRNHYNWKGDAVGYDGVHSWVRKRKPKPLLCERCQKSLAKELSNNSGKYLRDVNDYEWLCSSCHKKKDGIGFKSQLSNHQLHRIREFYNVNAGTQEELGCLFSLTQQTISKIVRLEGGYARQHRNTSARNYDRNGTF